MNLQDSIPTAALTPTPTTGNVTAIPVLYSVFRTLRAEKLSRLAYLAALMSVDSSEPCLADDTLLADPARVAAAVFRGVVLHDRQYLPIALNAWPPYRYGTGRTLWRSVKDAARTFVQPSDIDDEVRQQASVLIAELMREGGFLPSRNENRRVRMGAGNRPGQLLSRSAILRNDGSQEVVSLVKFIGERQFTILRQTREVGAEACAAVREQTARNNAEVFNQLGPDEPSTVAICLEFGMLKAHLGL